MPKTIGHLQHDATVLVSGIACSRPGCPPLETVIAFWTERQTRHHFKVFKPIDEVVLNDLPAAWLRDVLYAIGGTDFECC
jgi:hypothetical protein